MTQTIAATDYARNASKYIEILNKLRRMGAQSAVDLPTVVFCGNQSAGKSSLLEAISGVQLPRSEGTCTRCVMEIRLIESSEIWSCQVSLRKEYDADEKKLIRPEETKFGNIIKDKDLVELFARRAQKALLNPNNKPEEFFDFDFNDLSYDEDASRNTLKFTKNVVCLEIKGPKIPNLSLIDLPGIIRLVERDEDERFIRLIEELVELYISKEKSIIVATISCKDEIDNQAIIRLAKKADKLGTRTLGVLTKPDTIEEGTHEPWLKIMRGEAHKLALGYYIVRNPKPSELKNGITFKVARQNEMNFFEYETPWKNFHPRKRLGVTFLQEKLSELLIKAIKRNLPSIKKEVEDKLAIITKELGTIPEQLSGNTRIELYRMTKKCSSLIQLETTCSNEQTELWQAINKEFQNFKYNLCSTRPIFEIGLNSDKSSAARFDILKEFLQPNAGENENISEIDQDELRIVRENDVIEGINKARGRLLPGFIPYSAATKFIKEHQKLWKSPAEECLYHINEIMSELVNKSTEETFSRFPELFGRMKFNAQAFLEECKRSTENYINFLNEMEGTNYPFTLDEGSMLISKTNYLEKLHEAVKIEEREPSDTLEMVASVMAYFKLAFKRYADAVSLTIIHAFIDGFSRLIEEKLIEALEQNEDEHFNIDELIREDDSIKRKREELQQSEKHLREMNISLIRFGC
ncbi:22_t:CDS:2 [Funneliformis geosporum]|uniref:18503_t:CDS:1 n=1 Tax=Funneliformis geosporum TaxID=1117311 RepID=A0A9W4SH79_9GLOM|nr:22_t:CDS:2 [Funneliformis geosporum]CAI2169348.1 18503_t:CDS:2 [Funneliformis geosporum]